MFRYVERSLQFNKACLLQEQSRIFEVSGFDPAHPEKSEPETKEALELVDQRIAEVEMARIQLCKYSKMMNAAEQE